ncbi:helicase with zinc finger domain 2 [Colossoma macropomum]|uniref:helicase with zinc finger domain 2 n=1 Tax=Colossoma macropomum TaxID=42526 RepID=UPI00186546FD|nr:helicase with zinc finger domain 2 [Colossoma macropomum]
MASNKTISHAGNYNLHKLQETYDLYVGCSRCCKGKTDISYNLVALAHQCPRNILLARQKGNNKEWRPVVQRPTFPNPSRYEVCWYFAEGKGCTVHGQRCSYARSTEEAAVWNVLKNERLDFTQLINMLPNGSTFPSHQENLAPSSGCLEAVQEILSSFQGTFVELCKNCFHDSPRKISTREQGTLCTGHSWSPILVFRQNGQQKRVVYDQIRPLPKRNVRQWNYCKYVKKGEPCWHGAHRCWFAHSDIEMTVWMSESKGILDRSRLLHASQRRQSQSSGASSRAVSQERERQHYCEVCKSQFPSNEEFLNHCFTVKHRKLIYEDTSPTWLYRDPPWTSKVFKLCERRATCEYGDSCMDAHSIEELQEWRYRHKAARKKTRAAGAQGLLSYQDSLLEEYRHSKNKEMIMVETLPEVSVSCDSDLIISVRQQHIPHRWKFTVTSKIALDVVALMRQDVGATFVLGKDSREERSYSNGFWFETQDTSNTQKVYEVIVSFTSDHKGFYEQWLVFDFDMRPVLLQRLKVIVGEQLPQTVQDTESTQQTTDSSSSTLETRHAQYAEQIWQEGTVEIVPYWERMEAQQELLNMYRQKERHLSTETTGSGSITHQNYKQKMHSFLYQEEMEQDNLVRRLNLRGSMSLKNQLYEPWFGQKFALAGELFGSMSVSHSLTPDTPEGYMLKRGVQSALVGLTRTEGGVQRVYEAQVLKDTVDEAQVHVQLSSRCCTELQLERDQTVEMEIQFQLDRIWFCEMHKAVDILPDLTRVLPDLSDNTVPVFINSSPGELNEKQQAAMDFILQACDHRSNMAPLLIYGPFGTGKTFTLAKITLALAEKPQNKILICTHTNSSADLYVKDHFHNSVTADHLIRPLRIKAQEISLKTTDSVTLQYCHLSEDGSYFKFPDRNTLDATRIIITTTAVARFFHNMQLPSDYFSHIFIDEASQMLECQALMALGLAGEKTQVVLAGDHMQMGPKLFSVGEDKRSDHTLLNRLFHYYQIENTTTAINSRIIFNENYRSTKEIVEFVSTHFYVGKKDVIKAKGNVPPHPEQNALQFHYVRGECHLDKTSLTWFNPAQIDCVVGVVWEVMSEWPEEWQPYDPASVCVLSQGSQVYEIRKRLKQIKLHAVTVENAENVQGKQFRVIIITTVHTKDSLKVTEHTCLEFFNDMRVLNTAMTRAQSQVIVVGDAAALCCSQFGKCWRLWRSYIKHCICNESFYPEDFTLDHLDQELLELSTMIKTEEDDSSDDESVTSEMPDMIEDPILKELLDEHNDLQIKLTEEGLFPVFQTDNLDNNLVRHVKEREPPRLQPHMMWQDNSNMYKCELVLERYDSGYAKPLDEPTLQIEIKGRKNVGQSLSGDLVIVEILTSETPPKGKVLEVLEREALSKEFVCTIDNNDDQLMTPINICVPKLFTPFWKDKPNHIAIRNPKNWSVERFIKINEEARRNNLFVVKFLKWGKRFHYPLGIVVKVLPRVSSLEDGLKVLDKEYQLKRTVSPAVQEEIKNFEKVPLFTKGHIDFCRLLTFTIDGPTSQDLDDAISVRDLGQFYEVGIHIADVASFVAKDSELDKYARQQGTAFYLSEGEPTYMFPKDLSTKDFSLLPGCQRRCISLMTEVDKQTNCIRRRMFFKSVICSKRKFTYAEVEEILRTSGDKYDFNTLEGCLAIACHFAEVHRKHRKQDDWCYKSPDEDVVLGRRRSHRLVEELMIMFNHTVADRLLSDQKTKSLAPLRCQDSPNREELRQLLDRNASLIPMSIHLSSQLDHTEAGNFHLMRQNDHSGQENPISDSESFPLLVSVLKNLKIAALNNDIYRMVDLITTDDIHPLLLPLMINLRRLLYKSHVLRANSTHLSRIGHHDLELDSYTWASSPIRRYIDVIVQRLLHSVLDNTKIEYTNHDVDLCCVEFTLKNNNQSACQKKSHALSLASKLSSQNARKVAYIVEVIPTGNNFRISFPLNRTSLPEMVSIMYRDLQLADQPMYDEVNDCLVLSWARRVYSFSSPSIHTELKQQEANSVITQVPTESWKHLLSAIKEEKWDLTVQTIDKMTSTVHTRQRVRKNTQIPAIASRMQMPNQEEHYIDMSLKLKQGKIIEVQLGTDTARGLLVPAVQLLIVNPKFEICLEHTKNPIVSFSKYALCSSRPSYNTYMDYQKIWKPLCEMESACSAVAENESIIIEDAELKWEKSKDHLKGSFRLPLEKKAQWAIDGNLRNCFLCIRLRIQQHDLSPLLEASLTDSQDVNLMDVPGLIWIAHGVVTNVSGEEESKELTYMEIDFRINHMPMTNIPDQVFSESARFTVELIPKLLPDVRKENAIDNLTKANQLVKTIATGKKTQDKRTKIPTCNRSRFEIENHHSLGFPQLNNSQSKAIKEALSNEFTLIQGPPGTGKTVVGVHIVYWFFQENQNLPHLQRVENEDPKKRCILYCGPSNKSVDVVAGQLLKLQGKLKPLRVYSDQMEILEFPYPGSTLKLSRHSKRVEKPNKELRSITLHHRIRGADNPYSAQIQAFDLKIQRDQYLTDEEMRSYKDCLKKARKHELLQHDVILCTCTAASHPILAHVLNFQQIIIDECAMATEPEAFIPLVTHKPKQIVLLGDHKQLQPVVHCELLQRLGMRQSLFERYMRKALMLDTQYRMQEDICAFPSQEFYEGKLKTGIPYRQSVFMKRFHSATSIIFGHVDGKEQSLVVATERGNENSKANFEEAEEAVRTARRLIRAGIRANEIAILTPYNAQVAKIKDILDTYNTKCITVNTIMKSQGSEWRYVILSTVRSCPASDIETEPTKAWLIKKLGFVMDPNQVNVGITRAQEGLCIIGNRDLLWCSHLWRKLLNHYEEKSCVVDPARNIQIAHV